MVFISLHVSYGNIVIIGTQWNNYTKLIVILAIQLYIENGIAIFLGVVDTLSRTITQSVG